MLISWPLTTISIRPYQFDFLIHEWSSQKKWVGRSKYFHIILCNYESHYKSWIKYDPKAPRENLSCSISTWSLSLQSHCWAPQRSFPRVTKSVCSLRRNYRTRNQGYFSSFNCRLASHVINWWCHQIIYIYKSFLLKIESPYSWIKRSNWYGLNDSTLPFICYTVRVGIRVGLGLV